MIQRRKRRVENLLRLSSTMARVMPTSGLSSLYSGSARPVCVQHAFMCIQHSTRGACAVSAAVTLPFGSAVSSVGQHLLDCPLAVMPCRLKSIVHTGNNMQLTVLASIIWGIQLFLF